MHRVCGCVQEAGIQGAGIQPIKALKEGSAPISLDVALWV